MYFEKQFCDNENVLCKGKPLVTYGEGDGVGVRKIVGGSTAETLSSVLGGDGGERRGGNMGKVCIMSQISQSEEQRTQSSSITTKH